MPSSRSLLSPTTGIAVTVALWLLAASSSVRAQGGSSADDTDRAASDIPASAGTEDAPHRQTEEVDAQQPRYLPAIRRELEALEIEPNCQIADPRRGVCTIVQHSSRSDRDFTIKVVYSDRSDTVYLAIERFLMLPANSPGLLPVLRRLMELNWDLLLGKLEWDSSEGEVRLSMLINTDSNFDRRAFRSAVRGLVEIADRYQAELERLLAESDSR